MPRLQLSAKVAREVSDGRVDLQGHSARSGCDRCDRSVGSPSIDHVTDVTAQLAADGGHVTGGMSDPAVLVRAMTQDSGLEHQNIRGTGDKLEDGAESH